MSTNQYSEKALETCMDTVGQNYLENIEKVSPEMAKLLMDFAFENVWSRSHLDLKTRGIITVASLVTQQADVKPMKGYIKGALNSGATKQEIIETCLQLTVYAGFPAVLRALGIAKEVFEEENI